MKIEDAISTIVALDYGPVQQAIQAKHRADIAQDMAYRAADAAVRDATKALRNDFRKRLAPHTVELDNVDAGLSVAWDSTPPRVSGSLSGVAYPHNSAAHHRMRARLHPRFSLTFSTHEEYLAQVACLRAMLDAAVDHGY